MEIIDPLESYENIRLARLYKIHNNYNEAIQIYFDLIEETDEESEEYSYLLMEYGICLLENAFTKVENEYLSLVDGNKRAKMNKDTNIEEDLEYTWNCFDNARVNFELMNDDESLAVVHKYLGDILVFNNNFREAIEEYKKAQEHCINTDGFLNLQEDIAECHVYLEEKEKAIELYEECRKIGEDDFYDEKIEELKGFCE